MVMWIAQNFNRLFCPESQAIYTYHHVCIYVLNPTPLCYVIDVVRGDVLISCFMHEGGS